MSGSCQTRTGQACPAFELRCLGAGRRVEVVTLRVAVREQAIARVFWRVVQRRRKCSLVDTATACHRSRSRTASLIVEAAVSGHALDHDTIGSRSGQGRRRTQKPNEGDDQSRCPHSSSSGRFDPPRRKLVSARLTTREYACAGDISPKAKTPVSMGGTVPRIPGGFPSGVVPGAATGAGACRGDYPSASGGSAIVAARGSRAERKAFGTAPCRRQLSKLRAIAARRPRPSTCVPRDRPSGAWSRRAQSRYRCMRCCS